MPGEIDVADERRRERTEHDAFGELLRDHPVDADRRSEARLNKNGRVVDEVGGTLRLSLRFGVDLVETQFLVVDDEGLEPPTLTV